MKAEKPSWGRRRRCPARKTVKALRWFGLTLTCLVALLLFTGSASASFPDVPGTHPYSTAIDGIATADVISGFEDGTFGPDKLVIRQQFAKMIVKTMGLTVTGTEVCPFGDVAAQVGTDPFYPSKYVAVCATHSITLGTDSAHFSPTLNIRRTQVITMVVRAADALASDILDPVPTGWSGVLSYGDPDHGANIKKAEYNGLLAGIQGPGGTLASWDTLGYATRGEVAQILWSLWQQMGPSPMGREVKIGFVTPLTGPTSIFGVADQYCVERWRESLGSPLLLGDGKKHVVTIIVKDSQSDPNTAAQVAADLIQTDQVDLMMAASTADTVIPVADTCEAFGIPCISTDAPWEGFYFGRGAPEDGFEWTYHFFWGVQELLVADVSLWDQATTNKVVGALWPNDASGAAFRSAWPSYLASEGYSLVDPGAYENGTQDYTDIISQFTSEGVEILSGVPIPPDFTNFWNQAVDQGFTPKIATVGRALHFPQTLEALGDIGVGLTTYVNWSPGFPFKSSLTDETCPELAADFETSTGLHWTQALGHYAVGEIAIDALKRAQDLDDNQAILDALKTTKLDTIAGPVDFTSPVAEGTLHPVLNVYKSPLAMGQWVEGTTWPYDLTIVDNAAAPAVPVQSELQLLQ